jgi:lipoprotein-anchoring transpeptidase ErfK/SrfK
MNVGSKSALPARFRHAASSIRQALLASASVALLAGALSAGLPAPAAAQYYGDRYLDPYANPIARPNPVARPIQRPAVKSGLKPGAKANLKPEAAKDPGASMPKGPLQIVVSIADQHVTLYSNGLHVAQSPVSTGVAGRPTPTGVFSIIQKDRFHHSNLYSNAPMPFMERITWSGVALHEGPLPGYPASHGCIRMTHEFAARLWSITKLGVRVIVARNEVTPADFAHPRLFEPKAKPSEPPVAGQDPEKHVQAAGPGSFAQATISGSGTVTDRTADKAPAGVTPAPAAPPANANALRGPVEMSSSAVAETTGAVTPPAPAAAGEPAAAADPAIADPPKPAPDAIDPAKATPSPPLPKTRSADQPVKRSGTVAVFISRKEKKLFVRQGFEPLFDVPVEIEHPEQPLGTHVFTALGLTDNGTHMRWNVMNIGAEPQRPVLSAKIGPKARAVVARPPEDHLPPQTAAQALDRIQIPQEAIDRIGEILAPGASLVISDQGLGPETGIGTDFIVLTR